MARYLYVEVALAVNVNKTFTYLVHLHEEVQVGALVEVGFGHNLKHGVVIRKWHDSERHPNIKTVIRVVSPKIFSDELFKTLTFAAKYYIHNLGEVLFTALPPVLRQPLGKLPDGENVTQFEPNNELVEIFQHISTLAGISWGVDLQQLHQHIQLRNQYLAKHDQEVLTLQPQFQELASLNLDEFVIRYPHILAELAKLSQHRLTNNEAETDVYEEEPSDEVFSFIAGLLEQQQTSGLLLVVATQILLIHQQSLLLEQAGRSNKQLKEFLKQQNWNLTHLKQLIKVFKHYLSFEVFYQYLHPVSQDRLELNQLPEVSFNQFEHVELFHANAQEENRLGKFTDNRNSAQFVEQSFPSYLERTGQIEHFGFALPPNSFASQTTSSELKSVVTSESNQQPNIEIESKQAFDQQTSSNLQICEADLSVWLNSLHLDNSKYLESKDANRDSRNTVITDDTSIALDLEQDFAVYVNPELATQEVSLQLDPALFAILREVQFLVPRIHAKNQLLTELRQTRKLQKNTVRYIPAQGRYRVNEDKVLPQWWNAYEHLPSGSPELRASLMHVDNCHRLNSEQEAVYKQIKSTVGYQCYLIDGVTGSGKTEVYLQLIEHYLMQGKSCLFLVPEIGLTPQTVNRFKNRFKVPILIVHSNISDVERSQIYRATIAGQVAILIGTRSAVFAQLPNLGCIIIDEEHDQSYKQGSDFRYHARDLAITRAYNLGIPFVCGTATPSFKILRNVELNKAVRLELTKRAVARHHNNLVLLDTRPQEFLGIEDKKVLLNNSGITAELWRLMQEQLKQENQVLLFLNRRGYAPQLQCVECGFVFVCDQCDRPYTYHRRTHELRCHNCGTFAHVPQHCPRCNSHSLQPFGAGTEQIEKLCNEFYQRGKIIRIDRDTSRNSKQLEANLQRVLETPGAILVGTQMLAKGHHFPDVTLVALLNIDGLVFGSDYRSAERLAQLYVQVAGRAGRENKIGTVVLQTAFPFEPIYQNLLGLTYYNFSKIYMAERLSQNLPPYTYQAYLAIRHLEYDQVVSPCAALLMQAIHQIVQQLFMTEPHLMQRFQYRVELMDGNKQNNLHKFIVDFVCNDVQIQTKVLTQVKEFFLESNLYKKHRPIFYIDVDPLDA